MKKRHTTNRTYRQGVTPRSPENPHDNYIIPDPEKFGFWTQKHQRFIPISDMSKCYWVITVIKPQKFIRILQNKQSRIFQAHWTF
jgi:hypothetical protein